MATLNPADEWPACQHAQPPCATKQRADELETVLTIQQAITSRLDLSDVLQLIADRRNASPPLSLACSMCSKAMIC